MAFEKYYVLSEKKEMLFGSTNDFTIALDIAKEAAATEQMRGRYVQITKLVESIICKNDFKRIPVSLPDTPDSLHSLTDTDQSNL
jgi:hypothetical protein